MKSFIYRMRTNIRFWMFLIRTPPVTQIYYPNNSNMIRLTTSRPTYTISIFKINTPISTMPHCVFIDRLVTLIHNYQKSLGRIRRLNLVEYYMYIWGNLKNKLNMPFKTSILVLTIIIIQKYLAQKHCYEEIKQCFDHNHCYEDICIPPDYNRLIRPLQNEANIIEVKLWQLKILRNQNHLLLW